MKRPTLGNIDPTTLPTSGSPSPIVIKSEIKKGPELLTPYRQMMISQEKKTTAVPDDNHIKRKSPRHKKEPKRQLSISPKKNSTITIFQDSKNKLQKKKLQKELKKRNKEREKKNKGTRGQTTGTTHSET